MVAAIHVHALMRERNGRILFQTEKQRFFGTLIFFWRFCFRLDQKSTLLRVFAILLAIAF
jgi:hypothetical protein